MRALFLIVLAAGVAGGLRSTPRTRYQGMMLNARTLGAEELRGETARDPTLQRYVEQHGRPDFIYLGQPTDVELIYVRPDSRLVHFHRSEPDAPSTTSELSPLPLEVTNMLETDLRPGTAGDIRERSGLPLASCWTVEIRGGKCRTCCKTRSACSTDCGK